MSDDGFVTHSNRRARSQQSSSRGNRGGGHGGNSSNWRGRTGRHSNRVENSESISVDTSKVGRIIGKGGVKIKDIEYESDAKVKIGSKDGSNTNITMVGTPEAIAKAKSLIMDLVEEKPLPPEPEENTEQSEPFDVPKTETGEIDWVKLNEACDRRQKERWSELPPIIKDFYIEDREVAKMSLEVAARVRSANNDIRVKRAFDNKSGLPPVPNPVTTFEQAFKNYPEILSEIKKQNFLVPSPIQCQAWPILLKGEDMIGIAQTGTGKTLAFLLPALIHIDGQIHRNKEAGPIVLILSPTRELAIQIHKEVSKYQYKDIKSVCIYGGSDRRDQISTLQNGVDIVIATPGRLSDFIVSGHINIINFTYIVLDEADRMLDMGFEPQIRKSLFDIRPDHQTVMTSATWPSSVRRLAESYMKDPIQVNIGSLNLAAVHTVSQEIIFLEDAEKEQALFKFIESMAPSDRVIVFCGKKATASHVTSELYLRGIDCQSIHGNRDQSDREAALEDMMNGTVNILIATDVASRGIDIKDLTHVVNFDFPQHIEEYVHRVGRTGRAGKTGVAMSFITRDDWANAGELIKILEEAHQHVPDELMNMFYKFNQMKIRQERGGGGGARGGFRGGRGGGGRRGNRW